MEIITTTPDHLRSLITEAVAAGQPPAPEIPHEYLSDREAAEYLRCNPSTVRKWAAEGHIRRYSFGRLVRYRRADLDTLLSSESPEA